jgi:hypothetical protein
MRFPKLAAAFARFACCALACALVACSRSGAPSQSAPKSAASGNEQVRRELARTVPPPPFLKGVTYFGRAWPINFWNSDLSSASDDFESIKADGFNTVVMVVPWAEFQPHLDPVTYDERAFSDLHQICERAKKADLRVFFRVSYLWDFGPDEQMPAIERANSIVTSDTLQPAWQAYLRRVHDATKDCATGYFLSWEDYWHVLDMVKGASEGEQAVKVSRQIGFDGWARTNAPQAFRDQYADVFKQFGAYPVPSPTTSQFREIYHWFDDQISQRLLARAASIFPNVTIEARVDSDPVYRDGKIAEWFSHAQTYSVNSSPYLMTYWAPAMGAINQGETDTAQTAIDRFVYMQKAILANTDNRLFVEQFLYTDNTPKMRHNAIIAPAEMRAFLLGMPGPLLQYTSGYALWGYQNYRGSALYNGFFARGLDGWTHKGGVSVKTDDGSFVAVMSNGATLRQPISRGRDHYLSVSDTATFKVVAGGEGTLGVSLGGAHAEIVVSGPRRVYTVALKDSSEEADLELVVNAGLVSVTDLYLYRFVQESSARDDAGEPLPDLDAIREMNRSIDELQGLPSDYSAREGNLDRVIGVYKVEHDGENAFAWARPEAVAYLRAASGTVTVKGEIKVKIFSGRHTCRVIGFVDGADVGSVEFDKDGPFVMHLPVLGEWGRAPTKVKLASSCEKRPTSTRGDQRVLGFILDAIES